jgi:hypothetical protein
MLIRLFTIRKCICRDGSTFYWTDGELQVLIIAEQIPFIDHHFVQFYFLPREFMICCPFCVQSYSNTNLRMSSDRTVRTIASMCSCIRRGDYETLYNETIGTIKHSPSPMKCIPVNEAAALGTESATIEEHSFTVMQRINDDVFINHGLNQNPILIRAMRQSDLSFVWIKYLHGEDEFNGQFCLESTKAKPLLMQDSLVIPNLIANVSTKQSKRCIMDSI